MGDQRQNIDYDFLGKSIRKYRKNKNLTLLKLAEMIDVSESFIGQVERGKNKPSLETVVNLANALGVSVDDLLYRNLEAQNTNDYFLKKVSALTKNLSPGKKDAILRCIELFKTYENE